MRISLHLLEALSNPAKLGVAYLTLEDLSATLAFLAVSPSPLVNISRATVSSSIDLRNNYALSGLLSHLERSHDSEDCACRLTFDRYCQGIRRPIPRLPWLRGILRCRFGFRLGSFLSRFCVSDFREPRLLILLVHVGFAYMSTLQYCSNRDI